MTVLWWIRTANGMSTSQLCFLSLWERIEVRAHFIAGWALTLALSQREREFLATRR